MRAKRQIEQREKQQISEISPRGTQKLLREPVTVDKAVEYNASPGKESEGAPRIDSEYS